MGTTIGIGNRVGVGSGVSWETYWLELSEVVEMLWVNKFDGDNLLSELDTNVITVTNKDFSTTYIPETTSATFAMPNTASYIAADAADEFWFDSNETRLQKTFTDLITSTTQRTFIKYTDFEPYRVSAIMIIKPGVVIDSDMERLLTRDFKLWFSYFPGDIRDYGYMKDNRTMPDES